MQSIPEQGREHGPASRMPMVAFTRLLRGEPSFETVLSLPWRSLERATKKFSSSLLVEKESSWDTFACALLIRGEVKPVLVQVFRGNLENAGRAFNTAKGVLSRPEARHPHLLQLLGYSKSKVAGGRALIFPLAAGLSLEALLRRDSNRAGSHDASDGGSCGDKCLSLAQRLQIAEGAARGLAHIHDPDAGLGLVHWDIRPSKILVNPRSFEALVTGLERATAVGTLDSTLVAGTPGYMDPSLFADRSARPTNDVFSLGVILLELATGSRTFSSGKSIWKWVALQLAVHHGDATAVMAQALKEELSTSSSSVHLHPEMLHSSSSLQGLAWGASSNSSMASQDVSRGDVCTPSTPSLSSTSPPPQRGETGGGPLSSSQTFLLRFQRFLALARQCCAQETSSRPSMAQVVEALGEIRRGAPTSAADSWRRDQAEADAAQLHAPSPELDLSSPAAAASDDEYGDEATDGGDECPENSEVRIPNYQNSYEDAVYGTGDGRSHSQDETENFKGLLGRDRLPPAVKPHAGLDISRSLFSGLVNYSVAELREATSNFGSNILGKGAFGVVYRGQLRGTPVAIKRMKSGNMLDSGLQAEVQMLSRVRHPHVVTLMGLCPDPDQPCLVYQYLSGGDLSESMNRNGGRPLLSALDRFRIASEIASALAYMAQHKPPIVHRDLKPSNIMLDQHRAAKVADWGLSRAAPGTFNSGVAGTTGYIAPETAFNESHSAASDTFAFGVILLQLVTGVQSPQLLRQRASNGDVSMDFQPREAIMAQLDASAGPWPVHLAQRMVELALKCSLFLKSQRPTMVQEIHPQLAGLFEAASLWFNEGNLPSS